MAQLGNMNIISIGELEGQLGVLKWPKFVAACEREFGDRIGQIADRLIADTRLKAVFVSGPTASGKTTFSDRLTQILIDRGHPTHLISLDDYYHTNTGRFDDKGRPDFESIDTLDTKQIVEDFRDLLCGKTVQLPSFNFVTRQRHFEPKKNIKLGPSEIMLVEGLHGLSDLIAGQFSHGQWLGVFIMPWCKLLDGRRLLDGRELRMLRRISRDVLHRGATALSTLDYWPMIDRTEQQFFPQYLARADEYVNSSLNYEYCVIAPLAARQIAGSLEQYEKGCLPGSMYLQDQPGYADLPQAVAIARDLLRACERIPSADRSVVPAQSILNEFVQ
ncbi:MAG: uridine kinase family protein [Saccharofermentanales bacterium]